MLIIHASNLAAAKFCNKMYHSSFNPLPDKILADSKLKVFADNKSNVTQNIKCVFYSGKQTGKGENAGYNHFLFFLQCFEKAFSLGASKVITAC